MRDAATDNDVLTIFVNCIETSDARGIHQRVYGPVQPAPYFHEQVGATTYHASLAVMALQ